MCCTGTMSKNPSKYDALKARCDELQSQVIRFLKVEQDLVNTRNQLDRDLDRFRAIQAYSQRIIRAESMEEFAEITVESIIETFELECSALFMLDETDRCFRIGGLLGIDELHTGCKLDKDWVSDKDLDKEGKILIEQVGPDEEPFSTMGQAQVILASFHDDNHQLEGILMGGITEEKKIYYDEIRKELIPSFTVFTQQMSSLLQNFKAKRYLDEKVKARTKEITDSIQYASRIQNALLPSAEELKTLLPSYFILNKPRSIVSGDFYWVARKDQMVAVAVADCTGHGVPGAFMSILGMAYLNEILSKLEAIRASEILNQLRAKVIKSLRQTGKIKEAKDGMEIALCVMDVENQLLQYSGAFRPLYLFRDHEIIELKGDSMPIGYYQDKNQFFQNQEMAYRENDMIYIFSDGYVDQLGGPNRKTYKSKRFKLLLNEIHQKPLAEQKKILESEHEEWKRNNVQIDDILIMGIRFASDDRITN